MAIKNLIDINYVASVLCLFSLNIILSQHVSILILKGNKNNFLISNCYKNDELILQKYYRHARCYGGYKANIDRPLFSQGAYINKKTKM